MLSTIIPPPREPHYAGSDFFLGRANSVPIKNIDRGKASAPILPDFLKHECPRAFMSTFWDIDSGTYVTITFPCKCRSCPVCGPIWRDRYTLELSWFVGQERYLYSLRIRRRHWAGRIRPRINRARARYVAIEDQPGVMLVLTTEPIKGSRPISKRNALRSLKLAICNARPVKRPILRSKCWKLSPTVKRRDRKWKLLLKTRTVTQDQIRAGLEDGGIPYKVKGEVLTWQYPPGTPPQAFEWLIAWCQHQPPGHPRMRGRSRPHLPVGTCRCIAIPIPRPGHR